MWELYDSLLDGMEETETAEEFLIGPRWAAVRSSRGSVGIAPVNTEINDRFDFSYLPEKGMPLKEIATYIRSWNFTESSLALAAINAYYNCSGSSRRVLPGGRRVRHSFRTFCEENSTEGRTVLMDPYYNHNELAEMPGRLEVLRREPESRDYYYSAYRERIPDADRLILNGRAFVEKTAEPMIDCAAQNKKDVFLFGPDVPFCPLLLRQGIRSVWGFIVDRTEDIMKMVRTNMKRDDFLKTGHFEVMD